jgi:hypothetical protein
MSIRAHRVIFTLCAVFLAACSSTKSPQQTMVEDRDGVYKDTYKAYMEAEDKYLNLLFNIERMPEEPELWEMKRDQMMELEQLRTLMLQSREELDASIQDWEKYLKEVEDETKKQNAPKYANFRNTPNDRRSSPGELLPEEVNPNVFSK